MTSTQKDHAATGPTARLTIRGRDVPVALLSELCAADRDSDYAAQLARDGYLLFRGIHGPEVLRAARREVLERLAQVGEIGAPAEEGIATGSSRRAELYPDLGAFWKSVSEGPALRAVINGPRIASAMVDLFREPESPHADMGASPACHCSRLRISSSCKSRCRAVRRLAERFPGRVGLAAENLRRTITGNGPASRKCETRPNAKCREPAPIANLCLNAATAKKIYGMR